MTYLFSVLMGVLQGVAEFLPISSSGHLALFQHFFGVENYEETQMFFTVLLHLGTLISVCVYYWRDVIDMIREFFLGIRDLTVRRGGGAPPPPTRRLVMMIIVATLPLFAILPVKGLVEDAMSNVTFVSVALLATGFILFFSDRMARGRKNARNATVADALLVGCAQAVGTLPGISRSGITISAGLLRGFDRTFAVRFSFLMSLPAVLGANILSLKDALEAGVDLEMLPIYLVGMVVSGVVGYFAIRLVNLLADKGKFGNFAYYCWVVGLGSLIASFVVK
ncbi:MULTISPECIES: undecaprenyl-diphosphate phosphatase [Intestinimonas]|uniref:Undecaprenyl-diphosphatase n=3 Tax=Intestinimonas TaxID=1392389 RepID=A0ABS9MC07_9FIRM|nr:MULTISPECIES: undecaprenyl-diphosphate phosphatase [Intestinimonas]MDU1324670.1 undecaprenyl-diphosphate phosphatase [Clostridiales bacterium]CUQ11602.1 bacitracin resistance protein BacA [Flavonifractor plautii]SCI95372.1 Undecaprenyl-diphosphatase [uncultured Flavonifractor sp.]BDE88313.1 undecaprenyl-diphosphatase [Oscillospiraceae bacterium]MCG4528326.1 undecaprenyl-diphosphate phosphatase [Intestinimonas massiliensis (ex Afouda et al. 2020)]